MLGFFSRKKGFLFFGVRAGKKSLQLYQQPSQNVEKTFFRRTNEKLFHSGFFILCAWGWKMVQVASSFLKKM